MLRLVLIDDEILALNLVEYFIKEISDVQVVGKFTSFENNIENIKSLSPDVIFLDIEMPGLNGIAVAEVIKKIDENIDIVFVTAYDHYAIEAFRVYAVDYLLKPLDKERLNQTLARIGKQRKKQCAEVCTDQSLRAQFFGNFVLYDRSNQPIKWRTKKVKELCAYLLHYENEAIHKDQIIDDLWPDLAVDKAVTHLHTTIYQLRKELKKHGLEGVVSYVDERYMLNLDYSSDVKSLLTIIEHGSVQAESFQILNNHEYLSKEDYFWSIKKRQSINQSVIKLLETTVHNRDLSLAQKSIELLVYIDPFDEKYMELLIQFYLDQQKIKEAVSHYRQFEHRLWEEMQISPTPQIYNLVKSHLLPK